MITSPTLPSPEPPSEKILHHLFVFSQSARQLTAVQIKKTILFVILVAAGYFDYFKSFLKLTVPHLMF